MCDMMSKILGSLFLTDWQLTMPNEIGPEKYRRTVAAGLIGPKPSYIKKLIHISATAFLPKRRLE